MLLRFFGARMPGYGQTPRKTAIEPPVRLQDRPGNVEHGLGPERLRRRVADTVRVACSLRSIFASDILDGTRRVEPDGPGTRINKWKGWQIRPKPLTVVAADTCRGWSAEQAACRRQPMPPQVEGVWAAPCPRFKVRLKTPWWGFRADVWARAVVVGLLSLPPAGMPGRFFCAQAVIAGAGTPIDGGLWAAFFFLQPIAIRLASADGSW